MLIKYSGSLNQSIQSGYYVPNINNIITTTKTDICNLKHILDKFYDFEASFDKIEVFIKKQTINLKYFSALFKSISNIKLVP